MIRKDEIDGSFIEELVQFFPCVGTYLCHSEFLEKQLGITAAMKVIDKCMAYGSKFRAHRSVELWNRKIELFIKAKDPINAFLCYILSCHNARVRKFPEELYAKMMVQLEREVEYELQISADQLILCQTFKAANIFSSSTSHQSLQFFNQLVQQAEKLCSTNHPYIFPIKEIYDVISNQVRIEFLPSDHNEHRFVVSKLGKSDESRTKGEISIWKVHSNLPTSK